MLNAYCQPLLNEQVLTIVLCIKRMRLSWNFIVNDVQSATFTSHGAPCHARDLFPWLNTRVQVHISLWTIREYPKRHFRYLSDSGDTFLPLCLYMVHCNGIDILVLPVHSKGTLHLWSAMLGNNINYNWIKQIKNRAMQHVHKGM